MFKCSIISFLRYRFHLLCTRLFPNDGVKIYNNGYGKIYHTVIGNGNMIKVEEETKLDKTTIRIRGNNNRIIFGKKCYVGPDCSFWMEGDNITIMIGDMTTFTRKVHFCAQENDQRIVVGQDCMFSNTIVVRTSDSHPIYDESGKRINPPKSVSIGNHVWVAPNSCIYKGAIVNDGAIVGSNTLVTKVIPANSLAVGKPARVVKKNISWTREKLF